MKNYIEIIETQDTINQEMPQMIRLDVTDDADAEAKYNAYKSLFNEHKATLVEEHHTSKEGEVNAPCDEFNIIDGKVIRDGI